MSHEIRTPHITKHAPTTEYELEWACRRIVKDFQIAESGIGVTISYTDLNGVFYAHHEPIGIRAFQVKELKLILLRESYQTLAEHQADMVQQTLDAGVKK